jgi:hypothetical protein
VPTGDVYSLWESLYQVMTYLHRADPSALRAESPEHVVGATPAPALRRLYC